MIAKLLSSAKIARNIRNYVEYVNRLTGECVFRDVDFDSEDAWTDRGVWDVCCITKLVDGEYNPSNDDDVSIRDVAFRIATEDGWEEYRMAM